MIPSETDFPALARDIAATHSATPEQPWDAAAELLPTTVHLFFRETATDPDSNRRIFAGLADLLTGISQSARFLYSHNATHISGRAFPEALRPDQPYGPPEDDVLRIAIAVSSTDPTVPWPQGTVNTQVLTAVLRALLGLVACRSRVLSAVAVRHLLLALPGATETEERWLRRRILWLLDPRTTNPAELLRLLTAPQDPLTHVADNRIAPPRAGTPDDRPLPLSDWARWRTGTGERILAGRVQAVRRHSRRTFVDIAWERQIAQAALPTGHASELRSGDLIAVRGTVGATRSGELTLFAEQLERHEPSRSTQPLPHSPDHDAITAILPRTRSHLALTGFSEVMTPLLTDSCFGGASRPFTTWAAAADRTQYLRVTTELALLRFLAEGNSRCYEIGPSFRNEGRRGQSAKEFLMLEAYAADLDLVAMTALTSEYIARVLREARPLRHVDFDTAFHTVAGIHPHDASAVHRLAAEHVPATAARTSDTEVLGRRLWRAVFRQRLEGFTAVHAIPGSASPFIAGEGRDAQRVWIYVDGVEVAEVSRNERDPDVLAARLRRQFTHDPHAVHRDYRDVLALFASGVPACVGVGLGLTRLARLAQRAPASLTPRSERTSSGI